jgi:DNA-binding transcriptional LysR family regulator
MTSQTLTEAANRLRISQPAVSKQIKQLQTDLGFALFERKGHRLVPTFEVRTLLDQVDRVDASLDALNRLAGDLRTSHRGHLHIGCIPVVAAHLLPQVLSRYMGGQADMSCTIHTGSAPQVMEWVETQQVDLGICLSLRDLPSTDYTRLAAIRMECLLPSGHPLAAKDSVAVDDLKPYSLITVEPIAMAGHLGQFTGLEESFGSARIRVDMSFVACRMVAAGLGIAVADSLTVGQSVSGELTRRPLKHPFRAEIGTYTPSYRPRHRAVDELIRALDAETLTLT